MFLGTGVRFQSLNNYNPVIINGQSLYLDVDDVGPYGISTVGVYIDLIVEKKDPSTGTIVRAFSFLMFKDQEFLDLVKKYGTRSTNPSEPEYIIRNRDKYTQFIEEIVGLAAEHPAFKKPAQDVYTDLNSISF